MLKCNYCVHGTNFVSFCYRETWVEQFSVLDPHEKSGMVQKKIMQETIKIQKPGNIHHQKRLYSTKVKGNGIGLQLIK